MMNCLEIEKTSEYFDKILMILQDVIDINFFYNRLIFFFDTDNRSILAFEKEEF